jgi:uncharacterized tellurite resistance protein B-like protein
MAHSLAIARQTKTSPESEVAGTPQSQRLATTMPNANVTMPARTPSQIPIPPKTPPTVEQVFEALFSLLCCVMVADGRASSREKARIAELMRKAGATWEPVAVEDRIVTFISNVQKAGYKTVLADAFSHVPIFKAIGRQDILMKCVNSLTKADEQLSERERDLINKIQSVLNDSSTSG